MKMGGEMTLGSKSHTAIAIAVLSVHVSRRGADPEIGGSHRGVLCGSGNVEINRIWFADERAAGHVELRGRNRTGDQHLLAPHVAGQHHVERERQRPDSLRRIGVWTKFVEQIVLKKQSCAKITSPPSRRDHSSQILWRNRSGESGVSRLGYYYFTQHQSRMQ